MVTFAPFLAIRSVNWSPALKVVSIIVLSVFDLQPLLLAHLFTRSMLLTVGLRSNAG